MCEHGGDFYPLAKNPIMVAQRSGTYSRNIPPEAVYKIFHHAEGGDAFTHRPCMMKLDHIDQITRR